MSDEHEWYVARLGAAAEAWRKRCEDAAAVPSIQHRDLPEAVAALTERVVELTKKHNSLAELARLDAGWLKANGPRLAAERDAARARVAELESAAKLAPAANAEEVARLTAERDAAIRERDEARARVAVLKAAPPPRVWLTAEERGSIQWAANLAKESWSYSLAQELENILARETPPSVKVPPVILGAIPRVREQQWHAAIRAAGGEVEG